MAKNTPVEDEATEAELTAKQIINSGIEKVVAATGIDVQKNRYKAMRAIAFQAFVEAIEADDFDALVDRALENIDDLPAGWEIERPEKAEPTPKAKKTAPAEKPVAKKTPAKATPAKPAARKRPTR